MFSFNQSFRGLDLETGKRALLILNFPHVLSTLPLHPLNTNDLKRVHSSTNHQFHPLTHSQHTSINMTGRGKGGKGLGKGGKLPACQTMFAAVHTDFGIAGAKRHRKILRDNIQGITKPAIRRLARRGGVKRISASKLSRHRPAYEQEANKPSSDLRRDTWCAQDLPRERHPRCRHLH